MSEYDMSRKNSLPRKEKCRQIADIYLAIKKTGMVLLVISVLGAGVGALVSEILGARGNSLVILAIPVSWLAFSPFIFRVWFTYHDGIIIDAANDCLSFPASDVEINVLEIITFKQFFNHAKTEKLPLSAVEATMNETRVSKNRFAINLAGGFGSRQLEFNSKQKRDEFRTAVEWGMSQVGGHLRKDRNIDTGVYGG